MGKAAELATQVSSQISIARSTESQALPQTSQSRICNLTRSPSDLYAHYNLRSTGVKLWFSILPAL